MKIEGLEQLERHQLGQSALMQLELRADHNHRTAGVVDALAKQVLTEVGRPCPSIMSARDFERTLVRASHGLATTPVVEQRVDRFLQHPLLVAHDDLGRLELKQTLQTVVAVDDAPIQIVEVGGGETPAIERHQRAQLGWKHRQHFHDHPVGFDARALEAFENLQPLGDLLDLGF